MTEPTTWLWYISRTDEGGYDTFDSAVVAAHTKEGAVLIHAGNSDLEWDGNQWLRDGKPNRFDGTWTVPDKVIAIRVGRADRHVCAGAVVLASFNAG